MSNQTPPDDRMVLLYKKVDSRLYGYVAFYRKEYPNQKIISKPYRESSPFVIGQYLADQDGKLEVFGSVVFLLEKIHHTIMGFADENNAWNEERSRLTNLTEITESDRRYNQKTMDFVLLVSTLTRNLFDLIERFNDRSIPRLDYHGLPSGQVTLRELFDTLIHHRYYYFDGKYVRDLFSDDFKKKKSALAGLFMGYGFDMLDFVKGISEVIEEVRVKDLTQLLWGKFTNFTANSKPQDVISLIQNVHAFSSFLQAKIPSKDYKFMMSLMFDDLTESLKGAGAVTIKDTTTQTQQIIFRSPHIGIAPNLNKKEFVINVERAIGIQGQAPRPENLKYHTVTIGFKEFFRKVNEALGNNPVLTSPPLRFLEAAANG